MKLPTVTELDEDHRDVAAELGGIEKRLRAIGEAMPNSLALRELAALARLQLCAVLLKHLVKDINNLDPRRRQ